MKIFTAYKNGLISAAKSKKMATVIYAVTFLFALLLAISFRSTLSNIAGNSMDINSMIKGFDFTTYADFLRAAGHAISPFISAAFWFGVLYLIFTVFFAGGVLKILNEENQKFSARLFFEYCASFFFRFLRLAIYLLILQLIFALIVFFPLAAIVTVVSRAVQNEAVLFYLVLIGVIVYLFLFILILIIGDYAKIILFNNDSTKSLKSIWLSVKFVIRHLFSTYLLYLFILIAPIVFFLIYFYLDNAIGMVSGFTIFIMFLIQQILIWARTWVKIWFLGSEISLHGLFPTVEMNKVINEELPEATDEGLYENPLSS
jgi:hypothetical protein